MRYMSSLLTPLTTSKTKMADKWCRFVSLRKLCSFSKRNQAKPFLCLRLNPSSTCSSISTKGKFPNLFSLEKQRFFSDKRPAQSESVHHSVVSVVQRLHDIEESMRVKGYSLLRWGLVAIAMVVTTLYFFREEVRDNVADEVAVVATKSLGKLMLINIDIILQLSYSQYHMGVYVKNPTLGMLPGQKKILPLPSHLKMVDPQKLRHFK